MTPDKSHEKDNLSLARHDIILRKNYINIFISGVLSSCAIPILHEITHFGIKETIFVFGLNILITEFARRNIDSSFCRTMNAHLVSKPEPFQNNFSNRLLQIAVLALSSCLLIESFSLTNILYPKMFFTALALFVNVSLSMNVNKKQVY